MTTDAQIAAAEVADDESLLERRLRFLSLRNSGLTFGAIAERWNKQAVAKAAEAGTKPKTVTITTVRRDVEQAKIAIIGEATREGMIAEAYSVILDVRRANYVAMLNADVDAAKIILATVRDQRELFGLDQPKRMSIGVGTDVEFAESMNELLDMVNRLDAQKELAQVRRSESIIDIEASDVHVVDEDGDACQSIPARPEGATSPASPPEAVSAEDWADLD